jgi:hypothetical protein
MSRIPRVSFAIGEISQLYDIRCFKKIDEMHPSANEIKMLRFIYIRHHA